MKKLLKRLSLLRQYFYLNKSAKTFRNNRVRGAVLLGESSVVKNCRFTGKLKAGTHCRFNDVRFAGHIEIGKYTSISGPNTDLTCRINGISIGNFTSIARNVSIQEYNHNYKRLSSYYMLHNFFHDSTDTSDYSSKGGIIIGSDVWIGSQVVVLTGSVVGDGCVIGANSVVSGEIPPYSIAVGSPARVVASRFDREVVDALVKIKWWELPDATISSIGPELFAKTLAYEDVRELERRIAEATSVAP